MAYSSGAFMKRGHVHPVKTSGAETASTTHAAFDTRRTGANVGVIVDVTAVSGTSPTMTVIVEGSDDSTNWFQLGIIGSNGYSAGSVAQAPGDFAAAATVTGIYPAPRYVRTRSVIAGTSPSFTYSIVATSS